MRKIWYQAAQAKVKKLKKTKKLLNLLEKRKRQVLRSLKKKNINNVCYDNSLLRYFLFYFQATVFFFIFFFFEIIRLRTVTFFSFLTVFIYMAHIILDAILFFGLLAYAFFYCEFFGRTAYAFFLLCIF